MAKTNYSNAFAKFLNNDVKTAKIEALDGAEIKYRDLTMAESDAFTNRLIKDVKKDGKADIDFVEANKIKYEKVALILIEPQMTVEELRAFPSSAAEAINEINALVDQAVGQEADEGNLED